MRFFEMPQFARALAAITLASMLFIVLFVAYSFVDTSLAEAAVLRHIASQPLEEVSDGTLRMMMALGLIAIVVQLYILNAVRALFSLYACQVYLSEENGRAITEIGYGLVALPLVRFMLEPLWTIMMTHELTERSASISISSTGVGLTLGGLLMLMIGRSMFEASRVRIENEAFV